MRSDRGPVSLQTAQRSVLEDYKASPSGSFSGATRQPSAGRKAPTGKPLLPEFPRRDETGAYRQGSIGAVPSVAAYGSEVPRSAGGSGSYTSNAAGRSTSVPRPAPRTTSTQAASGLIGGSSHAAVAAVAAAAAAGSSFSSGPASPRGAVRCPVGPGSILDSLKTPSVVASLAQRMGSSSGWDYSSLAGGTSMSSLRLKRQAGIGPDSPTIPSMPCPPSCHIQIPQPYYTQPDPLRPVYLSGPAAGTAAGGGAVGTSATAAAAAAATAAASASCRRTSIERSAAERVLSRAPSCSSTTGSMYGSVSGGVSASGLPSPSAPPLPANGAMYASQYPYQYGSSPSTVYIPVYSAAQHSASGAVATYVTSATGGSVSSSGAAVPAVSVSGTAASYLATGGSLPPRPVGLSPSTASASAALTPLLPTTSAVAPSAPPLMAPISASTGAPAPPLYSPSAALPASQSLQRTLSNSLPRAAVGVPSSSAVGPSGAAAVVSATAAAALAAATAPSSGTGSRLRVVTVPGEEGPAGADGGSNSSLRRVQLAEEPRRHSGSGGPQQQASVAAAAAAATAAAMAAASAGTYGAATAASGAAVTPVAAASVRPPSLHGAATATASGAAPAAADQYHYHQQPQYPHSHPQYSQPHLPQPQPQPPYNPHCSSSLEAGGSSYSSTSSTVSSKSSVAAAGTGVSSASSSRTGSSTSQRSSSQDVPSPSTTQQHPSHALPHQHQQQHPHHYQQQHSQQHPQQQHQQPHPHGAAAAAGTGAATRHAAATASHGVGSSERATMHASSSSNTSSSSTAAARHAAATATAAAATTTPAAAGHGHSDTSGAKALADGASSGNCETAGAAAGAAGAQQERGLVAVCGLLPDLPVVVPPRDMQAGRGCVGLQNLGNTCFMNSILQSLNAVPELVQQFLGPSERHWSSKAVVAPAYSSLVRDMMSGCVGGCVNPSAFLRKVSKHDGRWGDGRQQDSQEFLNSLLEVLQSECNRITAKPTYRELQSKGSEEAQAAEAYTYARSWNDSIVDDIFGGLTQSTIQCHACNRLSHTFEPFLGLALPIPGAASPTSSGSGPVSGDRDRDGSVSVAECLRAFVECEELEGDDSYKCEACKRRQPHSKRLQIFRPPRVLVLTLKRFAQRPAAPGFFSRFRSPAKNNTPVRLDPELLDLTPYCNPLGLRGLAVRGRGPVPPVYQLVAVSHHSGSLEGGHYTAQARSCLDGQWYNFNDSSVRREGSRPCGASSSAYVLFYRLANLPPSNL